MNESSKSQRWFTDLQRAALAGTVLDIGAGADPVAPGAVVFDLDQGDANRISSLEPGAFDCVYSSHCLEHMVDPVASLANWWTFVRPGGVLFLIVPDEDLYEQGVFPSRFNSDHKATFTIAKKKSWSARSFNVFEMCQALPGARVESLHLNDIAYDRARASHGENAGGMVRRWRRLYDRAVRRKWISRRENFERQTANVATIDQTSGPALAQIEILVRKETANAVLDQSAMAR